MTYVPGKVIADLVRKEIKAALAAGEIVLPAGMKVSVRTRNGNSVDVELLGAVPEWLWEWSPNRLNGFMQWNHTPEAETLRKALETIRRSRQVDTTVSPGTADYFTANYYGHTQFDWVGYPEKKES